ncbi:MAG: DUF1932 domain-containing protein [Gammaproteobacteria bacterium]|nr:DUF1932 domain-containing protein [Gammaproteobacteria bacterium]MYF02393.1 DUF1932 domain-containing protein [Gammaproteobacteria bacterium]MYI76496.1 DUF1932 domain-containing protein [Gammaproteobacteria bacterium]
MTRVLLLHPGAMGSSLGHNLVENGHEVFWISEGRSETTEARATQASLTRTGCLADAITQVEVVLSVCPPENAIQVGCTIAETDFSGTYCDANAIAPATSQRILDVFGDRYVDGGIVGPPAHVHGHTRLYLSGSNAQQISDLFRSTRVQTEVLVNGPLTASAMKMCYAAYTKGTAALILGIRALAEHYGVSSALQAEWSQSQNTLWDRSERMGPGTSRKAWRFAPEMREIAKTFNGADLPSGFHEAAAEIYSRMASLKYKEDVDTTLVLHYLLARNDTDS